MRSNPTTRQLHLHPDQMTVEDLATLITYYNEKYFIEHKTLVNDEWFDLLTRKLKKLVPNHPALEYVG